METDLPYYLIIEDDYQLILYQNTPPMVFKDNLDVEVVMKSGQRYTATLFTLENIKTLMDKFAKTGECNYGMYFSAVDMIIVSDLTLDTIKKTIRSMVDSGELSVFFANSSL